MTQYDKETLEALDGSIAKWEAIVNGTGGDIGPENCPLCQLFFYQEQTCLGCPVRDSTDFTQCLGTPYMNWTRVHKTSMPPYKALTAEQMQVAKDELQFLTSLKYRCSRS